MNQKLNLPYKVITFGCQMNVYDSSRMERLLSADGCYEASGSGDAKIVIINTCTVREKARNRVLSLLGRLRPLKDKNPDLVIAVAGCVAQQERDKLLSMVPHLDIVMGTDQVDLLPALVRRARAGERVAKTAFSDEEQLSLEPLLPVQGKKSMASAFVTVATGCDKRCSFCVVPSVRGVEKCRAPEEILDECEGYLSAGVKEIILIGQTVNSYKYDSVSFAELLKRVNKLSGLERLRFLTSHPIDMTDDLINCFGSLEHLCEAIHLPVQSGSNSVLKRMIRRHTREYYIDIVERLRKRVPEISITTDIIVGFPGESDSEFEETMLLLDEVRFDGSYSFIYSPRPGLPSTRIPDPVSNNVKAERLARYNSRQNEILLENNRRYEGLDIEVLLEGSSRLNPDIVSGRSRSNKIVNCDMGKDLIGRLAKVKIREAQTSYLYGA